MSQDLQMTFCVFLLPFLELYPSVFSIPVEISVECKKYCENRRPVNVSADVSFKIDCSVLRDMKEWTQCTEMCEKICPRWAVCKDRGSLLECPPKSITTADAVNDDHIFWELLIIYGGFLIGFLLVLTLVAVCIYDLNNHRRELGLGVQNMEPPDFIPPPPPPRRSTFFQETRRIPTTRQEKCEPTEIKLDKNNNICL